MNIFFKYLIGVDSPIFLVWNNYQKEKSIKTECRNNSRYGYLKKQEFKLTTFYNESFGLIYQLYF